MRVLVCGGRDYSDWRTFLRTMNYYVGEQNNTVIQGGAKGADFLGKVWAEYYEQPCEEYPADWKKHGRAAGFLRNQQMLDDGKPDLVIAFPGGRGTADMVQRSKDAKVPVVELGPDAPSAKELLDKM